MPADLILYALVAAGLIFWLKSILGTRDDNNEMDKPKEFKNESDIFAGLKPDKNDKVVPLHPGANDKITLPRHIKIDNKTTENAIEKLQKQNPNFDLIHFVQGAESAFGMIVEAFAEGDLETLENLLAEDVFNAFKQIIEERQASGETVETEIKAIEKMDIIEAIERDEMIFMTVRFSARETCVIRDKNGDILAGNPEDTTKMVDVWVFGRDADSQGPEWYLFETRDEEIEDHKTPIPEGGKKATKKSANKSVKKKAKKSDD